MNWNSNFGARVRMDLSDEIAAAGTSRAIDRCT